VASLPVRTRPTPSFCWTLTRRDQRSSHRCVEGGRSRRPDPKDFPYGCLFVAEGQVPFIFNGKINKLTFTLGPERMLAQDLAKLRAAALKAD
jgi:hypothetical protein